MQGISVDALDQTGGKPDAGVAVERGNVTQVSKHHKLSVFEFATGVSFGTHWEAIEVLYGTIDQSMLTLFLSISSGLTWSLAADPISKLGTFYGAIWTVFMFFTLFGLLNVLTGIFVDAAIKAMMNDRDNMIATQMEERESLVNTIRSVFHTSDSDGSGMITDAEFETLLGDDELVFYLKAIGIDSSEARGLFRLLDDDNSGMVSIDEFVTGFLKLKGSAKSVDMATLLYEHRKVTKNMDKLVKHMNHLHQGLNRLQAVAGTHWCQNIEKGSGFEKEGNVPNVVLSRVMNDISGMFARSSETSTQVASAFDTNGHLGL